MPNGDGSSLPDILGIVSVLVLVQSHKPQYGTQPRRDLYCPVFFPGARLAEKR
jgi:hypothetical protein